MPRLALCAAAAAILGPATAAHALDSVIQPGVRAWHQAAQTGRADLLIMGDSVVLTNGGWDAGMHAAAAQSLGIAGTGLIPFQPYQSNSDGGQGHGVQVQGVYNGSPWDTNPLNAYHPAQYLNQTGTLTTTGTAGSVGFKVRPEPNGFQLLDASDPMDLHVWSAAGTGGDSYTAVRQRAEGSFPSTFSETVTVNETAGNALTHHVHSSPADPTPAANGQVQFTLNGADNLSVTDVRLVNPDATGLTITSWGYGSHTASQFLNERYLTGNADARAAWLERIVDSGTGKLTVMLFEGLNDRNGSNPAIGDPNGDATAAEFRANMLALINAVKTDWLAAGYDADDLNFLTLGVYEVNAQNDILSDYAIELQDIALNDGQVSFIDLKSLGLTYADDSDFYLNDPIHLNLQGATYFSNAILAQVPEPTGVLALLLAGLACLKRRRRA